MISIENTINVYTDNVSNCDQGQVHQTLKKIQKGEGTSFYSTKTKPTEVNA